MPASRTGDSRMAARPSRFAVLKIEGDSDEEITSTKSKGNNGFNGLMVRAKGKKPRQSKKKVVETGFPEETEQMEPAVEEFASEDMSQALKESLKFMEDEKKSDEELNKAIAESLKLLENDGVKQFEKLRSPTPLYGAVSQPDPLETVLQKSNGSNEIFITLLQDQIKKLTGELGMEREKVLRASHGEQKYKERYQKLLSLLQEVELKKAVENVCEINKRDQIIEEQAKQIKEQQDELEKLRSQSHTTK